MGTVYKAYDSKIREAVAIKLLKPEIASDLEVIERFRNEIKLARKVAHRYVCRMYDLDEEWLSIYISMEYVPGEDLKSFIRRSGHLNEAKALALARQIAEGLAEAHRMGVVHRDLKPQNVMIDREGNAKIMDFGIARSLHTGGRRAPGSSSGPPSTWPRSRPTPRTSTTGSTSTRWGPFSSRWSPAVCPSRARPP
jgi:serine/threonine protein kinase